MLQFVLSPVLLWRSFVSTILANLLYMVALSYYHYLSFLGYSALPFLEHTEVFPVACGCHCDHCALCCAGRLQPQPLYPEHLFRVGTRGLI